MYNIWLDVFLPLILCAVVSYIGFNNKKTIYSKITKFVSAIFYDIH